MNVTTFKSAFLNADKRAKEILAKYNVSEVGYLADYMKYEEEERLKVPWEEE